MKKETQEKPVAPQKRWHVSLECYKKYQRSFSSLAAKYLCPDCRQKWADKVEIPSEDIVGALRDCCSLKPDFLPATTPVLESVFATVLAGGNQPMTSEEISRQLLARRGDLDGYRFSPMVLDILLDNDDFYGFTEGPQ